MDKFLKEYQTFCSNTNKCVSNVQEMHLISGLGAECGEVLALYQKFARDVQSNYHLLSHKKFLKKRKRLRNELAAELGDILWHISELARWNNINLEALFRYNRIKLIKRHLK